MYLIHVHQQSKTPGLAILHCTGIVLASRGRATFRHDYLWVCGCWLMLAIANAIKQLHWCILEPTSLNFFEFFDMICIIELVLSVFQSSTLLNVSPPALSLVWIWRFICGFWFACTCIYMSMEQMMFEKRGVLGNFLQRNNFDVWKLHWLLKAKSHIQRTPTSMPPKE